ncbi:MAG: hypothetical protein ACF8XB_05975 [Planctomycetota bacterium JB042]
MDATELFKGIGDAKASYGAEYERVGHYIQRLDRLKAGENRAKEGFLAIEKTVLYVYPDTLQRWENEGKPQDFRPHVAGDEISHLLMRKHDSFLANVKGFFARVLGCPEEEVTLDACAAACDEEQPMAGYLVEVRSRNQITRKNTNFTKIDYVRAVPPSELKELLPADEIARLFPNGSFEELLKIEAAAA